MEESNKTNASAPQSASNADAPKAGAPQNSGAAKPKADGKASTPSKADKKSAKNDKKEAARLKKEWEDSIVASKRVKREETRRKFKQAMVIMLVFALVVTSVVYVMLLFMQENNVRITASSKDQDKTISLSMDNSLWTPYLNASGPADIWDVSYNPVYDRERIDTVEDVREMLSASTVRIGEMNGKNYIRFVFMVKNQGKNTANISYEMTLDYDKRGLQNAVRVMWGESFKSDDINGSVEDIDVTIYAAKTNNPRLAGTNINAGVDAEDGYLEYVAYPPESNKPTYDLIDYEREFANNPAKLTEARQRGYFATTPFDSDEYVFQRYTTLAQDDIMYCYVCIWIEGSDFDCVDSALGGYVKLGINFVAY